MFVVFVLDGIATVDLSTEMRGIHAALALQEHQIVEDSVNGEKALLLIGRSGTGKTTIAMKRMAVRWQLCRKAGYPWSVARPQNRHRFRSRKPAFPSASAAFSPSRTVVRHGVFVTANGVLVVSWQQLLLGFTAHPAVCNRLRIMLMLSLPSQNEVREVFRARQLGAAGGDTSNLLPEKVLYTGSLSTAKVTENMFPLFISASDWLYVLDATMVDPDLNTLQLDLDDADEALRLSMLNHKKCNGNFNQAQREHATEAAVDKHQERCNAAANSEQHCRVRLEKANRAYINAEKPFIERDSDGKPIASHGMLHQLAALQSLKAFASAVDNDPAERPSNEDEAQARKEVDANMFESFWKETKVMAGQRGHHYSPSAVW